MNTISFFNSRIRLRPLPVFIAFLLVVTGLLGCKEGTVGPERLGTIEGRVLTFDTRTPIGGVSITTSPPTGALVTNNNGEFVINNVEAGNYTIAAQAPDFDANTVTIQVRDDQTTQATIFLEETEEDTSSASLDVSIANWSTYMEGDSSFVRVQYRAMNTGSDDISLYEVYFRIATEDQEFFQEVRGEALAADQTDVGEFDRYTLDQSAEEVAIEDFWIGDQEPQNLTAK